jgi:hypothetical protein
LIDITPMMHQANSCDLLGIINGIQDAVVTHPHAEASMGALDPLDATWAGILSELLRV